MSVDQQSFNASFMAALHKAAGDMAGQELAEGEKLCEILENRVKQLDAELATCRADLATCQAECTTCRAECATEHDARIRAETELTAERAARSTSDMHLKAEREMRGRSDDNLAAMIAAEKSEGPDFGGLDIVVSGRSKTGKMTALKVRRAAT